MKCSKKILICILILILLVINNISFSYAEDLNLTSEAAILMDFPSGIVLYSKNADVIKYPASTTKILTAIIVIEKCNLDEKVTASNSAIKAIPAGYSNAEIQVDETLTVDELLQVFLVHSANEAGYILAEHISGSIEKFAELMNEKAKEIGCKNSNFTNPSGLHNPDHYSTAYDLCLIAKYCMQNDTFRNYVSMESCTIHATDKHEERLFSNTNELLVKESQYYDPNIIGIKTGFTTPARNCLITGYSKDGTELIAVVLDAPANNSEGLSAKFTDSINLFNYGIGNFSKRIIVDKSSVLKTIEIENSESSNLDLLPENSIVALLPNSLDISLLTPEIILNENLSAPIWQNTVVGKVVYTIDGVSYSENLIAGNSVEPSSAYYLNYLKIILAIVLLVIVFKLMYGNKEKKKNTRKRRYK